jgi:SAM-dependent methyltransferase
MTLAPSPWVQRWSHLVPPRGSVLDVACGSGRHVRWFADRGCRVTAVDRDAAAVEPLQAIAELLVADIENGPWPFAGRRFDAVIVTNYLWRPLSPTLIASVADGGVLIYETFADGNQTVGKPSNPNFLLKPGELLQAAQGLEVVAYENGFLDTPPRFVQRMAAMKSPGATALFPRRHLTSGTSTPGRLKSSDSEEPA